MLRIPYRCGCICWTNRYQPSHLHTGVSRRRLHCIQTLPVGICRWASHRSGMTSTCHRSWTTSTRLRTRALCPSAASQLSVGKVGNWLEGAFSQGRARSRHQLIQTRLCSQPRKNSSWTWSRDVDGWWANQTPTWRLQHLTRSVLLCQLWGWL